MDSVSNVDAIIQIMRNALNTAITTARFVNNIQKADKFHNDFIHNLERSQNTVMLMLQYLSHSNNDPWEDFQEIKDIRRLIPEIAKDCDKCYDSLIQLYDVRNSNIINKVTEKSKMEIHEPEIESVNTRLRANVGNIQTLLSILQLTSQVVSIERMEDFLQEIHANIRRLPQLRNEIITAQKNLNNNQDYIRSTEDSKLIDLSRDASAGLRITEDTFGTASSIYERLSTDSGYASLDRNKTHRPEDGIANTVDELSDAKTAYSDTSNVSEIRKQLFIQEFVDLLLQRVSTVRFANDILEYISKVLPALLKAFALRIGLNAPTQMHRDVMFFVHKYQRDITESFKERLSEHGLANVQDIPENEKMPLVDIMGNWYKSMKDQTAEIPSEPGIPDLDDNRESHSGEEYMPDQRRLQGFISKSPAYEWLLSSLCKELNLTSTYPHSREAIHQEILSILPSYSRISKMRSTAGFYITFRMNWNPLKFVMTQGYKERPDDAIERAITLTGCDKDAQALTCKEYLAQVWPSSGEDLMELVKKVVSSTPGQRHIRDLSDGTKLTAWMDDCTFVVEAIGTRDSLAEICEQLAWLGAALRSSAYDSGVATCVPFISDKGFSSTPRPVSREFTGGIAFATIDFHMGQNYNFMELSNGKCWHNLFRNPVVVGGYPILRRSQPCPGLELSLKLMIALTQARFVTTFGGKVFIKGFSTVLIPTKIEREMATWHLLFNADGSHISYMSSQIQEISGFYPLKITISGLETDRHVIGTLNATYNLINWSGLEISQIGCDFEKIYISRGRLVTHGVEPAIGQQDLPLHVGFDVYMDHLRWISRQFVILYDIETRRAWLVDGASALLHLVRTSLKNNKDDAFKEDFIFKWEIIKGKSSFEGRSTSIRILKDTTNKELKLYSRSNYRFKDRVEQIHHTLKQILTHQTQINIEKDSGFRLRDNCHKTLEGFDFMDIATEEDHFWARMAEVQIGGTS